MDGGEDREGEIEEKSGEESTTKEKKEKNHTTTDVGKENNGMMC